MLQRRVRPADEGQSWQRTPSEGDEVVLEGGRRGHVAAARVSMREGNGGVERDDVDGRGARSDS